MHTDRPIPSNIPEPNDGGGHHSAGLAGRAGDHAEATAAAGDAGSNPLSVPDVLVQRALLRQIVALGMKEGEHYGRIPGWGDKPTLFKAGAEKLCFAYQFTPGYEVAETRGEGGHREYRVLCSLTSSLGQGRVGQGVGLCTTMEARYRFRRGATELTGRSVPRAYWDLRYEEPAAAQELLGGRGYQPRKVDGVWMIARAAQRLENTNLADCYNTVLKMAKKRALVDAVLTATAASDLFTQDLEDLAANLVAEGEADAEAEGCATEDPSMGERKMSDAVMGSNPTGRGSGPGEAPAVNPALGRSRRPAAHLTIVVPAAGGSAAATHGKRGQRDGGVEDDVEAMRADQVARLRNRMQRPGATMRERELLDYLRQCEGLEIASLDELSEGHLARLNKEFRRIAAAVAARPAD